MIFKSSAEESYFYENISRSIIEKSSVYPTGVDLEKFSPVEGLDWDDIHNKLNISEENLSLLKHSHVILYAGRISSNKGVDSLVTHQLEMDQDLKSDTTLLIVGNTVQSLSQFLQKCEGSDSILVSDGRVPHSVIPKLLQLSSCTVLLSEPNQEGAPKILQESLVMGTPCVASDVSGISEVFNDISGCCLIPPESSTLYEKRICEVVQGKINIDTELVKNRFSIRDNYREIGKIYESLVE
jgi:glycosyltransferase involved in cell wall biosynthesis